MTTDKTAYTLLTEVFNQIITIGWAQSRLLRDQQTHLAPGSVESHDAQIVVLSQLSHEKIADPRVSTWLDEAEKNEGLLDVEEKANLKAMRTWHVHEAGLPAQLAGELSQAAAEGERVHAKERASGNWSAVAEHLQRSLDLARSAGEVKREKLGLASAYDALLDQHSPGWRSADYDRLFDDLEPFLKSFLPKVVEKQAGEAVREIEGPFAEKDVEKLCRDICVSAGFDQNRGVMYFIDAHPYADGNRDDLRISGRPSTEGFLRPLYDMMHETGHAIYDQNTPAKWTGQPAGLSMGMDIHESQSLIWEFIVGKSPEFAQDLSARAKKVFARENDPALSAENIFALNTRVEPGNLVRLSERTSEVTYLLHIIMRYRLEKEMIEGRLEAVDLPQAWGDMTEKMFGARPKNNADGCMQDVHWYCGLWGYFPSYAVGYVTSAQLYGTAVTANPDLPGQIAQGNFAPLKNWLTENVHEKGRLLPAQELISRATGKPLGTADLKKHLQQRYLP